jgi:acetolactate synthase-1/2/3 large subunit
VICLIGLRAGELDSWFEAPDWPVDRTYIQIQETPEEIWHGLQTAATVVGSSRLVLRQINEAIARRTVSTPISRPEWIGKLGEARAAHSAGRERELERWADSTPIHTHELAQAIADVLAPEATVIFDSYQGSLYLTDAVTATFPGQVLDAGPRVALGQGVGMCFGAAIARPGTQVLSLIGDGGIGLAGMDIETFTRYEIPAVFVILNNSSWGGNSLAQADIQPNLGSWEMMRDIRYDEMFAPLGCHVEHVTESGELRPALRRALESGKPAVVNVIADADSPAASLPWLRLKTGEYYSRGIADLPPGALDHFRVSAVEALRLQKTARDNGTTIPLSFMAQLTGTTEDELEIAAAKRGYHP